MLVTEYAVFEFEDEKVIVKELLGDLTIEQLQDRLKIQLDMGVKL